MMQIAVQTAAEQQNRNPFFSVAPCLMKAIVGPIFSLRYELWITANSLFLPCLTYCGHRLIADSCFYLDSLPQCSSPTLCFPSLCYCLIIALQKKGLLSLREEEADSVSVQVTLPKDLTCTVPPRCCIMDEGQTLGGRGGMGAGPLLPCDSFLMR